MTPSDAPTPFRERLALLWPFFALVFVFSVPIWIVGGQKLPLPVNLPVSALTAFVPAIAASIIVYRRERMAGVRALA